MAPRYVLERHLPSTDYDDAIERVTTELQSEGFGVLTEIDVKATLKKKIGADFRRYIILGACNPGLANQALASEVHLGALLPCNVVVMERDGGGSTVFAFRPTTGFEIIDNPTMADFAREVETRIERALDRLEA